MSAQGTPPQNSDGPGKQPSPRKQGRGADVEQTRDDRLKAALKANMARRKAQAKARSAKVPGADASASDNTDTE